MAALLRNLSKIAIFPPSREPRNRGGHKNAPNVILLYPNVLYKAIVLWKLLIILLSQKIGYIHCWISLTSGWLKIRELLKLADGPYIYSIELMHSSRRTYL